MLIYFLKIHFLNRYLVWITVKFVNQQLKVNITLCERVLVKIKCLFVLVGSFYFLTYVKYANLCIFQRIYCVKQKNMYRFLFRFLIYANSRHINILYRSYARTTNKKKKMILHNNLRLSCYYKYLISYTVMLLKMWLEIQKI